MASSSAAPPAASAAAIRRLHKDLEMLQRSQNPQIMVRPSDNILVWHFVLHSLPSDTPYHGGCYHGKIIFPEEYPHKPPAIQMITPSGRLEVGVRLCLSMTDFHPESWNPAWSMETILVGLLSFFISDKETGYGSIKRSPEERRQLAVKSSATNSKDADFRELFPEFLETTTQDAVQEVSQPTDITAGEPHEETVQETFATAATEGADLEAGEQNGNAAQEEEEEEPEECWICRDTSLNEPLIQPCACRGSMSGVHASCVEQWIAHHRQNAVNNDAPRCAVCHQPYLGHEERPGLHIFAQHMCCTLLRRVVRIIVLAAVLVLFQCAAAPKVVSWDLSLVARVVIIALFSLLFLYKIMILMVSQMLPPPQNFLRYLYVGDPKERSLHWTEASASVMIMILWCLNGIVSVWYVLPYFVTFLIPMMLACCPHGPTWNRMAQILTGLATFVITMLALPALILIGLLYLLYKHPMAFVHPLGACWHTYVAIAAMLLCLLCRTNVPVVSLLAGHAVLVAVGLLEQLVVKKLQWHAGPAWMTALLLVFYVIYVANLCPPFTSGVTYKDYSFNMVVIVESWIWAALVGALVFLTNWALIVAWYQGWQRRHGRFTLNVPPEQGQDGAGGEDVLPR